MPKREKTPDHEDNEYKYFTVYNAYPLHANWELPSDRYIFTRWISCIIGMDKVIALYHKPKARNMVLVEAANQPDLNTKGLLGEHRWEDFLKAPNSEEIKNSSKIYYCTFPSGRAAQKEGWKRLAVEDDWFKVGDRCFQPDNNRVIAYPYPDSSYCEPPPEDRTNKPLCRFIPKYEKMPAPKPAPPVVGSTAWATNKSGPGNVKQKAPVVGSSAWSKGSGPASKAPSPPAGAWANAQRGRDTAPVKSLNNNGVQPAAVEQSPRPAASAWGMVASPPPSAGGNQPLGPPPGLAVGGAPPTSGPPGLVHSNTESSSSRSSSSSAWNPPVNSAQFAADEMANRLDNVHIEMSPSQFGDGFEENNYYVHPSAVPAKEEDNLWASDAQDATFNSETAAGNLWDNYAPPKSVDDEIMCPDHGNLCKKGICKTKAKLVREREKKDREEGLVRKKVGPSNGMDRPDPHAPRGGWQRGGGKPQSRGVANGRGAGQGRGGAGSGSGSGSGAWGKKDAWNNNKTWGSQPPKSADSADDGFEPVTKKTARPRKEVTEPAWGSGDNEDKKWANGAGVGADNDW